MLRRRMTRNGLWATAALAERDSRARALGIDPAGLPRGPEVLAGATGRAALVHWATNNAPLPDGTRPVDVTEADRLLVHGEAADADVVAIDFLRLAPDVDAPPGASVANVALLVHRRDGSSYRTLARFGFRTRERREAIGRIGATVPVRLDPTDPNRVALDRNRLPPPAAG